MDRTAGIGALRAAGAARTAAAVLGLGVLAGLVGWAIPKHPAEWLSVVLLVVTPAPIYVRLVQKRFDPFEPIQIVSLTLFILFALRPAAELVWHIDFFANKQTRPGFTGAAAIALVGILSLYAGYALSSGRKVARRLRPLPDMWDARRAVRFAVGVLAFSALLTALFAATVGPSTLLHFYTSGRTDTDYTTFLAVSGYVGLGPYLTIPAAFILIIAYMRLRTIKVGLLALFSIACALFITVPRGDRTYILVLVLPMLALPYLKRNRRPSGLAAAGAVFVAILAMNVLLATRHAETRSQRGIGGTIEYAVTRPGAQFKDFLTGVDLAEYSVVELEYQAIKRKSDPLKLHPFSTAASLIGYPLPRKIVHSKPQAGGEFVVHYLFPLPPGSTRSSFNPSMFGDFFDDYAWVSLVFWCGLLGVGIRTLWEYFRLYSSSEGLQIAFAALLPMLVVMIRNNLTDAVGRSLYQVFPLILCLIVCSRQPVRRFAGFRTRPGTAGAPQSGTPQAG
jgi:hypothetical protein